MYTILPKGHFGNPMVEGGGGGGGGEEGVGRGGGEEGGMGEPWQQISET